MDPKRVGAIAATFVAVGMGVGAVGSVATGWAEAAFAIEAGGDAARFGPVFVAQLYLSVTAAALVAAPVLAGVVGVLFGSRSYDHAEAAGTCGVGTAVGAFGYGSVIVAIVVASQGAAAEQAYGLLEATRPILVTAIVSGGVGAATGVLGVRLG